MIPRIEFIGLLCFLFLTTCSSNNKNTISSADKSKKNGNIVISTNEFQNSFLPNYSCDTFNINLDKRYYVDKNGWPCLGKDDSLKLINYAIKSDDIKYALEGKDTVLWKLFYLLPRTREILNTDLYDSIIALSDTNKFHKLEKSKMYDLIESDAVILGEVIDKRFVGDTINCFYYKTEYIVRVDEVLHSYFKLEKNDNVILKSTSGFVAGCNPKDPKLLIRSDHIREFKIRDKWIFLLKHNEYYSKYLFRIKENDKNFNDKYCSRVFQMYNGNNLYDFNDPLMIENIRLFYKKILQN